MKRIFSILTALVLFAALFSACGRAAAAPAQDDGKLSVVSTIFPGYDFTRQVAGNNVSLAMLLPPGSESHSFEPSPQDIIKIQNCDVFLYVGGESDSWVDGILDSMDTSGITLIAMMELVDTVEEERKEGMEDDHEHAENENHSEDGQDPDHGEEEEDHDDGGYEYDEHVWTSPVNAMAITNTIAHVLGELDEENAQAYRSNAAAYVKQLEELDASFRTLVQGAKHKTLVFGDRFPFRYFADEYGLDYYAAFPGCSSETEASPKTVAFLIGKVEEENIPVVFHIEFSNEKMADTICEATGAEKMLLHSCHNVTGAEFENGVSYLALMQQNLENLETGLN